MILKYPGISHQILVQRQTLIVLLLFTFCSSCMTQPDKAGYAISIAMKREANYLVENGRPVVKYMNDTVSLYVVGDYSIYQLLPIFDFSTERTIKGTERFFIHKKNNQFGYYFDSPNHTETGQKLAADSFLALHGFPERKDVEYPTSADGYKREPAITNNPVNKEHVEIFTSVTEGLPDTVFFHFKKMDTAIRYTFSRKLDSITGSKLFKLEWSFKPVYTKDGKLQMPHRNSLIEIIPLSPLLPENISSLLNRLKKNE